MIFVTNSDILGKNIRHLREKNHMSCDELAEKVGWNVVQIQEVEAGVCFDMDAGVFAEVCRLFDIQDMTDFCVRELVD